MVLPAEIARVMAEKVIAAFHDFFLSIGIPMHLSELGVRAESVSEMADHILELDGVDGPWMYVPLDKDALVRILRESM